MGKPWIERIGDMFQLLLREYIITETSLMTQNIKLRLILMNWMCFPLQVWGGFARPAKNWGVWGAAPPSQKSISKLPKMASGASGGRARLGRLQALLLARS